LRVKYHDSPVEKKRVVCQRRKAGKAISNVTGGAE